MNAAGSPRATVSSVRGPSPLWLGIGQFGPQLLAQLVEDLLEDLAVELLLGLEVAIDDELGDPAGGGDVVHGRVGETRRGEGRGGAAEDGGPPFGPGKELALDRYT